MEYIQLIKIESDTVEKLRKELDSLDNHGLNLLHYMRYMFLVLNYVYPQVKFKMHSMQYLW